MSSFSRRYNYDPAVSSKILFEDAPERLRIAYINSILDDLTYIDSYPEQYEGELPLEIHQLYKEICVLIRQEPDDEGWEHIWYYLKHLIKSSEWYSFYDICDVTADRGGVLIQLYVTAHRGD